MVTNSYQATLLQWLLIVITTLSNSSPFWSLYGILSPHWVTPPLFIVIWYLSFNHLVNVVIRLCCINTVTFMSTFYAVYVIHLTNHVKRNILSIFHHSWYLQVFPWYIIRLNIRSVRFYWWISVLVYDCWLVNSIPWIFQICWYLLYKSRCYCCRKNMVIKNKNDLETKM
jgi:hypothetical protein